jgi:hypothetical protein
MTKTEEDTDPSTPTSKRNSDPAVPVARPAPREVLDAPASVSEGPPEPQDATEPGLGPAGARTQVSKRGASVVVPPAVAAPRFRRPVRGSDSVDVLLDGIAQQPLRRVRTTPQTAGQSAATYHAQHGLRAARTNADNEPLVVVDTPPASREVNSAPRKGDAEVPASVRDGSAKGPAEEPKPALETEPPARTPEGPRPRSLEVTPVFPEPNWRRVAVAVFAGVIVVVALAMVLHSTSGAPPAPGGRAANALDVPSRPIASALPASRALSAVAAPVETLRAIPPPPPPDTISEEAPTDDPPRAHPTRIRGVARTKPTPSSSARPPDLGEFKTTY